MISDSYELLHFLATESSLLTERFLSGGALIKLIGLAITLVHSPLNPENG
jgi:hypothetical protein